MTFMDLSAESGSMASVRVGAGQSGRSSSDENAAIAPRAARVPASEPRCVVRRLEIRRPEVSKHRIVPGLVGLLERDQRRADENDHAVAVDLSGLRCAAAGL